MTPTPPLEKPCTRCRETKPLEDFHLCKTGPFGRAWWCKLCFVRHRKELSAAVRAERVARKAELEAEKAARRGAKEASRATVARLDGWS